MEGNSIASCSSSSVSFFCEFSLFLLLLYMCFIDYFVLMFEISDFILNSQEIEIILLLLDVVGQYNINYDNSKENLILIIREIR